MRQILITMLLGLVATGAWADRTSELERVYLEREKAGLHRAIPWQPNFQVAKAKAQAENKPLFVFLVVGHNGQKNASQC